MGRGMKFNSDKHANSGFSIMCRAEVEADGSVKVIRYYGKPFYMTEEHPYKKVSDASLKRIQRVDFGVR